MSLCIALILAAGRGHRFGAKVPKQYLHLNGQSILRHTIAKFVSHIGIDAVRVVINQDDFTLYDVASQGLKLLEPVIGGLTRQDSVRLGLESLVSTNCDRVLIHDSVRPFVEARTITHVIEALSENSGAIAAIPVCDSVKRTLEGVIVETVDRTNLWYAQTPQGFHFPDILNAYQTLIDHNLTDDAAVAKQSGILVRVVPGQTNNIKITSPSDLDQAIQDRKVKVQGQSEIRVGSGFDVHAFGQGDRIWLCGIQIPYSRALIGHSDADVALHAVTDALLGAIAAGDIGRYFPQTDPRWLNSSSETFARYAADVVRALGGEITAIDITILCEQPKVAPYRFSMVSRLSAILCVTQDHINIKGKTTEGLGFTGRCEGIAAHAVATIKIY